jgi:hypothetical protein
MHCPRLDHFVRFNPDSSVSRCGHMINAPRFPTLQHMENSDWLVATKEKFKNTCLERYGIEHPSKLKETKEKIKNNCLQFHLWVNIITYE